MIRRLAAIAVAAVFFVSSNSSFAQNLLKNPGFEDPSGWSYEWKIRDANGGDQTYHYHLGPQGGGHGDARPRTGSNAVEIYTSDRQTYLCQTVNLQPGTYRMSAWARLNNTPDSSAIELRLGDKKAIAPLASEKYRLLWADLTVDKVGDYEAVFYSPFYGVAFDDLSVEKLSDLRKDTMPAMNIDLWPSSHDRSSGIQYCLKGTPQWVNFVVTCLDPTRAGRPVMRVIAPEPVKLSGLNESLINGYRMREEETVKVTTDSIVVDGRKCSRSSFPLPRFVSGYDHTLSFGGCWVSNVPKKDGRLIIEIVDPDKADAILARETLSLVSVDAPGTCRTPRKYYTIPYAVQNWQMSLDERVKALPKQFRMMGYNVWSDYGLTAEKPKGGLTNEEIVLREAYKQGVRTFWPNFSSMLDTGGGGCYSDASSAGHDMYLVTRDGKEMKNIYNPNYCANRGEAWMKSAIVAWTRTQSRPVEQNLPFRYTGFINDSLEGLPMSYDPSTLAAFATYKGITIDQVTPDRLNGEWKRDWLLFNMDLYTGVVNAWVDQLRKVDPHVRIVNTAGTFGPAGFEDLTIKERMKWARQVDYNMPQWYATGYYGTAFTDEVDRGDAARVFGKQNGGTDVIPLLDLSMGGGLEDPEAFRFRILDHVSQSKSIKGIGYYIGTFGFTDAKFMVGMSRVHTLLADVEDYYADGVRDDSLVTATPAVTGSREIQGMDMEGKQAMVKVNAKTAARAHRLDSGKRVALITIVTHSEQGVGEQVTLKIDKTKLPDNGEGLILIDKLSGRKTPLPEKLTVDTSKTKNIALFEIVRK